MSKQETALYRWLEQQHDQKQLNIADIHVASVQLHSLIKGSCFWPQLMGLSDTLKDEEAHQLALSSAEMFLARYQE